MTVGCRISEAVVHTVCHSATLAFPSPPLAQTVIPGAGRVAKETCECSTATFRQLSLPIQIRIVF